MLKKEEGVTEGGRPKSRDGMTHFEGTSQIHGVESHVGNVKKKREETAEERILDTRSGSGNVHANIMERFKGF